MPFVFQSGAVDQFAKIASVVTLVSYGALVVSRRWIVSQEDGANDTALAVVLIGLSIAGVAGAIIGALIGPHPA